MTRTFFVSLLGLLQTFAPQRPPSTGDGQADVETLHAREQAQSVDLSVRGPSGLQRFAQSTPLAQQLAESYAPGAVNDKWFSVFVRGLVGVRGRPDSASWESRILVGLEWVLDAWLLPDPKPTAYPAVALGTRCGRLLKQRIENDPLGARARRARFEALGCSIGGAK